jgi:hypothetical protein
MRRECDVEAGERKWIERVTGCGHGGQLHGQKRSGTKTRTLRRRQIFSKYVLLNYFKQLQIRRIRLTNFFPRKSNFKFNLSKDG